jgi:hypothetical protein
MAALSKDRNTARAEGDLRSLGVAAAQLIYAGAMVMRNASGFAVKGTTALNLVGVGRAEERVDNAAGAAGDKRVRVRPGIYRYANSAASDEVTIADIGALAYAVDDQTVAKTSGTNTRSIAGFVDDVDAQGVWVRFDEAMVRAYLAGVTLPTP